MPPKSKPKPSTKRAPKRADHAGAEPEVLNQDTVAADAAPVRAKPAKTVPALDELAAWLVEQPQPVPVRVAITTVYGKACDPKRELETLKLLKGDERFVIKSQDGVNTVGLVGHYMTPAAKAPAPTNTSAEPPAKTLGEHVADAKASPQRITWPHRIGSSVLLLTKGQPSKKATIRNIADHGSYVLYDLNLETGGTCDGTPASRIGRDLDAEGEVAELRAHLAVLERHQQRGRVLAQRHVEMAAEEVKLAEVLSKHRKSMAEVANQLAEHARAEPGQTDLRDVVGDGNGTPASSPTRGLKLKAPPSPAEDKLAEKPAAPPAKTLAQRTASGEDVVELAATGLRMDQLQASAVNQSTASTGKPQQVKPVKPKGLGEHVLADVQKGLGVLLPLYSKQEWTDELQPSFGYPLELPTIDAPDRLTKGGKLTGTPVRVGRATRYVGPEVDALLVRLPPIEAEPEPRRVGKDAAAGD